ncbi:MAG: sulfotransferase domain-containing protein [bacterium]|nr:sulfotransferase domain-containing protein [bacterium]
MSSSTPLKPVRCYFVILFDGRAGSSYLVSLLNQHKNILCHHEIFAYKEDKERDILQNFLNVNFVFPRTNLDSEISQDTFISGREKLEAIGFKAKLCDIDELDSFAEFLKANSVKVIHLYRRNVIKSLVSTFNGQRLSKEKNGLWNIPSNDSTELGQISIDPQEFRNWFHGRILCERVTQDFVEDLPLDVLRISYEDLFCQHEVSTKRILNFLGFKSVKLRGKFKKITSDKLSEAVSNLDALMTLFPKDDRILRYFRKYFK